jgi:mono/diheme cytochrome c family protein
MAQSQDDTISEFPNVTFNRNDLPEGHARLVIREQGVTTVIQGESEKVSRRLDEEMAADLNLSVEELEAVAEYPMPDPLDDEPVEE